MRVSYEIFTVPKKLFELRRCSNNRKSNYRESIVPYKLRPRSQFHIPPVRTVFSGTDSIKFLSPKIWEFIPDEMKELESLWEFKKAIKLWKLTSCPCRLCRQYFCRIGFL